MKLKKSEYLIILIMAAVIFFFLSGWFKTDEHTEEAYVPPVLEKMNLDGSGRYLVPVFDKTARKENIVYSTAENENGPEDLKMDIYYPEGGAEEARPLILWVHGGGYTGGDKSSAEAVCTDLARRGFVCASINYRLKENPTADWDQTMIDTETDTISALTYLRANCGLYGIDKYRIFIAGDSAGGCIALNTGFKDAPLQSDADRGGVIGIIDIYGSDLREYADLNDPPVLIIHGTDDTVVSYDVSRFLAQNFNSVGHPFDFVTMYGIGHNYSDDYDEVLSSIVFFIFDRLQELNGTPFENGRKNFTIGPGQPAEIVLKRTEPSADFKGSVKITAPEGWTVSGDMAITDQSELDFEAKPSETGSAAGMKLLYFDFSDEKGAYVSRVVIPVQVVSQPVQQ